MFLKLIGGKPKRGVSTISEVVPSLLTGLNTILVCEAENQQLRFQNSYRKANCITRGCVSKLLYAPKLFGDCVSEVSSEAPTPCALKRVRFGTLKTSHRNCRL